MNIGNEDLVEQELRCVECAADDATFTWTRGEQLFWKDHGWTTPPKRCKYHRDQKRARFADRSSRETSPDRPVDFVIEVRPSR